MDPWSIIAILTWPVLLYWWGDALLARLSPKYAAKRQLKADAKLERRRQARYKRQERQQARLVKWAESHPDDPDAKKFLAREAPSASQPAPDGIDFLAEIRRSQQSDDEYKQRRANEKAAKELLARQTLDWAIDNPAVPEARRHLKEQLEEVTERLVHTERNISHCQTMLGFMRDESDPEYIAEATRLSEYQATKETEAGLIRRIQAALDATLPVSSGQ